tara:strand:- start:313 stop:960 length:648 start_codon:yes stop_codon:yes gene_type:complete
MDAWLIALIVLAIVILIVLIILAIFSVPDTSNVKSKVEEEVKTISDEQKQHNANLAIAFIDLSHQTSNFLQQAKCGYKGVGNTYDEMNKIAKHIGHCLHRVKGNYGEDVERLLCEKNDIYRELTEEVLVNKKVIKGNDSLLECLNDKNVEMAEVLYSICPNNTRKQYISMLHEYDVLIVSQMGALSDCDYKRYLSSCKDSRRIYINISMFLCYSK